MAKKRKAATSKSCGCISKCNEALADRGLEVDSSMVMNFATGKATLAFRIPLRRKEAKSRVKIPTMLCTYCPVCGKKAE